MLSCIAQDPARSPETSPEISGSSTSASTPTNGSGSPVATPAVDLRKLTVLVLVKPPSELRATYEALGRAHKKLEPLFVGAAEGGFGSGSLVAGSTKIGGRARPFVVTNRHVVSLSSGVSLVFDGVKQPADGEVVFVDPAYDLAVVAFEPGLNGAPDTSSAVFTLELAPAKDMQTVVASGYPGIGSEPSYQVTRGTVSNERFETTEDGSRQRYVQHTAPIDPGSSGGPLTTESGRLLGVNTLKIRRRENVGLAIPASVVKAALEDASKLVDRGPPHATNGAKDACEALAAALERGEEGLASVERSIGTRLVAREGLASLDMLPGDGAGWGEAFVENPTAVLLRAVAERLALSGRSRSGADTRPAEGRCTPAPSSKTSAEGSSFQVALPAGERRWTFGLEQRRFKLVDAALEKGGGARSFVDALAGTPKKTKWKATLK